ncbi:MAG TPA: glycosyltransferase family 39 protein [Solirubrobacteraceae bacterium]|nr:glycosyltransferase family 39 protein [Solirubrobacteraceae bacterium]
MRRVYVALRPARTGAGGRPSASTGSRRIADLLALGIVLAVASSALLAAAMRVAGRAAFLLATALLGAAQVVGLALLATPFHALTRTWWLAGHADVLALAAAAWWATGRPLPAGPWLPARAGVAAQVRRHPAVATVVVLAVALAVFQLVLGLTTAPLNYDSMTYHLSRAAYWLQHESIAHYPGGTVRQLASPPNAEIGLAWTMALAGSDTYVSLVQWLALWACALGVWMLARELRVARAGAAFAAAVWVLLPGPIVESATTQNDLVVTAFVLATTAFGIRALRRRDRADTALAGIAFGLALGAKSSLVFMLPALAVVLVAALVELRPSRRTVAGLGAALVAGAAVFGAYGYAANVADYGGPFGGLRNLQERTGPLVPNVGRLSWSLVDSPGVSAPWVDPALGRTLGTWLSGWKDDGFDFVLGTDTDEDRVAGGLVVLLVLVPLAFALALRRRGPPIRRTLAIGAILSVVAFGTTQLATPFNGRIIMPAYALAVPLLGVVWRRPWARSLTVALAVTSALPVVLANPYKPVLTQPGTPTIWSYPRYVQMTMTRPYIRPVLAALDRRHPRGTVLMFGGEFAWDYPFFGERRQHELIRYLPAKTPATPAAVCSLLRGAVAREHPVALVFDDVPGSFGAVLPSLRPATSAGGITLVEPRAVERCSGG